MFFDDYPAFYEPSRSAAIPRRLNLRHQAIIRANRDILWGARVLDLASRDGRWAFAAHKEGAVHVTAVEARKRQIERAREIFEEYRVAPEACELVRSDPFRFLASTQIEVDVVLCVGIADRTLRHDELARGIAATDADHCILDTKIAVGEAPPALHLALDNHGYELENRFDWPELLARRRVRPQLVRGYASGQRVTLRYRKRGAGPVEVLE